MKKKFFKLIIVFIMIFTCLFSSFYSKGYKVKADTNDVVERYDYGKVNFQPSYCTSESYYQIKYFADSLNTQSTRYYFVKIVLIANATHKFDIDMNAWTDSIAFRNLPFSNRSQGNFEYISSVYQDVSSNYINYYYDVYGDDYGNTLEIDINLNEVLLSPIGQLRVDFQYGMQIQGGSSGYYGFSLIRNFVSYDRINNWFQSGKSEGIIEGKEIGYRDGMRDGTAQAETAQYWFVGLFNGIQRFLNIEIMGITLGTILLVPFAISFVWFIIRQFRGGGGD